MVSYEIEPDFQKANDLKYPPKKLDVRYDEARREFRRNPHGRRRGKARAGAPA